MGLRPAHHGRCAQLLVTDVHAIHLAMLDQLTELPKVMMTSVLTARSHVAHLELPIAADGNSTRIPVVVPLSAAMAACSQLLVARYGEKSDGLVTRKDAEVPGSVAVRPERKLDHAIWRHQRRCYMSEVDKWTGLQLDGNKLLDLDQILGYQVWKWNVNDVVFSNIKMSTKYYHPLWWGRAEPIYITTCPRHPGSKEGTISDIRFINISSVSENGVFLAGSKHGLLCNLKFKNVDLTYKR